MRIQGWTMRSVGDALGVGASEGVQASRVEGAPVRDGHTGRPAEGGAHSPCAFTWEYRTVPAGSRVCGPPSTLWIGTERVQRSGY